MRVHRGIVATVAVVAASMAVTVPAEAAAPLFQLPFPCGQTWRGDSDGSSAHESWEIDFNRGSGADDLGDPVVAAAAGTVRTAAHQGSANGYGNLVKIEHAGGYFTYYAHLNTMAVREGQSVAQGATIGSVGDTSKPGNDISPHLHYEVRLGSGYPDNIQPAYFDGVRFGYPDQTLASRNCGGGVAGTAFIYGTTSDGRLTYTTVNAATGDRTHGAVVSGASLGFAPKAMATVNFNTILVTSPAGQLYRVDVITNDTSLTFAAPVPMGGGWTHDLLAYDGRGSLYGIADGAMRRYTVLGTKPGAGDITSDGLIDTGFTLKTLTATGQDWLLGTTSGGELLSYRIRGAGDWTRYELRSSTWQVFGHLLSAGGGVYFGHNAEGGLLRYTDANPYDGSGADLRGPDTVDAQGWTQVLLSAQPGTVA
ncbi:M23 family metallopeptidase [Saccharothrix sp. 6-C]|uniref:M23 family metallopeptidase n=1 Tax=Saccharothrix sp. 6-C TaxID=2781735 RepID=UPI0019172835|nr:M23 family metallopeptidase [Saccharothrix sp. 6-C]QQQ79215.1 M23 family metallopeptidase [Saccharothrix sp. 6-C]